MEPIHGNRKAHTERYVFQLMTKDWKFVCISHTDEFLTLSEFLWKHSLIIDDSLTFGRFSKPYATYEYHAHGGRITIDVIEKK